MHGTINIKNDKSLYIYIYNYKNIYIYIYIYISEFLVALNILKGINFYVAKKNLVNYGNDINRKEKTWQCSIWTLLIA